MSKQTDSFVGINEEDMKEYRQKRRKVRKKAKMATIAAACLNDKTQGNNAITKIPKPNPLAP